MSDYTSSLLCHFVGRSKANKDERFELLIKIIKGSKLITNILKPDSPKSHFQVGSQCEHAGEVFCECDCVCFCDIPNDALSIHVNKYSKFGMGFDKAFIAKQGARPVMYVPQNFEIVERGDSVDKSKNSETPRQPNEYYPYLLELSSYLLPLTEMAFMGTDLKIKEEQLMSMGLGPWLNLMNNDIRKKFFSSKYHPMFFSLMQGMGTQMAYVKLYDATLPDDHPDNYYMEREWRSLNNVTFTLDDIKTIYLPSEEYKEKFQKEFPEYNGDYFIFEN